MANDVMLTIMGRLTADPEIRFVASGGAVTSFTVAHNSRKFNKQKNEWEDSEPTFYRCSLWGGAAENVANSLRKGARRHRVRRVWLSLVGVERRTEDGTGGSRGEGRA